MNLHKTQFLVKCYVNALRRAIVRRLLGNSLVLEQRTTEAGTQLQLIDTRRRLNYGYWEAKRISVHDIKLSWCTHEKF